MKTEKSVEAAAIQAFTLTDWEQAMTDQEIMPWKSHVMEAWRIPNKSSK